MKVQTQLEILNLYKRKPLKNAIYVMELMDNVFKRNMLIGDIKALNNKQKDK